jgi:hypothetical protein
MVRFTRPGHRANHVGKNAATNPKLQARRGEVSPLARKDSDLTLQTGVAGRTPPPDPAADRRR